MCNCEPSSPRGSAFPNARPAALTLHVPFPHRECTRGGFCNFMHLKPISRELRRELYGRRRKRYRTPERRASVLAHHFKSLPIKSSALLRNQAPLSLTLPGTTLPLQGSTAGPREAAVEGTRALWKILKEDETDPPNLSSLSPTVMTVILFHFFFFFVNCWKCFFFLLLFPFF